MFQVNITVDYKEVVALFSKKRNSLSNEKDSRCLPFGRIRRADRGSEA